MASLELTKLQLISANAPLYRYGKEVGLIEIFDGKPTIKKIRDIYGTEEGATQLVNACENEATKTADKMHDDRDNTIAASAWTQQAIDRLLYTVIEMSKDEQYDALSFAFVYFVSLWHGAATIYRLANIRKTQAYETVLQRAADKCRSILQTMDDQNISDKTKENFKVGFTFGADEAYYMLTDKDAAKETRAAMEERSKEFLSLYLEKQEGGKIGDLVDYEAKSRKIEEKYRDIRDRRDNIQTQFIIRFSELVDNCKDEECRTPGVQGYYKLPSSPATYALMGLAGNVDFNYFSAKQKKAATRYGNQISIFDTRTQHLEYSHSMKELSKNIVGSLTRPAQDLLTYLFISGERIGWRDNSAIFNLDDYLEYLGHDRENKAKKDYIRKQINGAGKEFMNQIVTVKPKFTGGGTKKDITISAPIVNWAGREEIGGTYVFRFDEGLLGAFREYFTIMPEWAPRLPDHNARRLMYLVSHKMQVSHTSDITINMPEVLNWLGYPTTKEEFYKKYSDRHHDRRVREPVQKAIDAIMEAAPDGWHIDQTLNLDPRDEIEDFLESSITIKADNIAREHLEKQRTKIEARRKREQRAQKKTQHKTPKQDTE